MDKNNIYIEEDNDFLNEELLAEVNWSKVGKFLKHDIDLSKIKNLFKKNAGKNLEPISTPSKSAQLVLPVGNIPKLSPPPKPSLLSKATSKVGELSKKGWNSSMSAQKSAGGSIWRWIKGLPPTERGAINRAKSEMELMLKRNDEFKAIHGRDLFSPKQFEENTTKVMNKFDIKGPVRRLFGLSVQGSILALTGTAGADIVAKLAGYDLGATEKAGELISKGYGKVLGAIGSSTVGAGKGVLTSVKDKAENTLDKLGPNTKKAVLGVGGVGLGAGGVLAGSALAAKLIMDTHKHSAWKKGGCDAIKNPIDRRKCKEYVIDEKVDDLNKKLVYDCFDDECKNAVMDEIKKLSIKKGELTSEF